MYDLLIYTSTKVGFQTSLFCIWDTAIMKASTVPTLDARPLYLCRGVMSSSDAGGDRKSSASSAAGFAAREAMGALAVKAAPAVAVAAEEELERCFEVSGTNCFCITSECEFIIYRATKKSRDLFRDG